MAHERVRLGEFVLERDERRLLGPAGPVSLAPKAFDALCVLVEQAGSLVSRDELQDRLWPGGGVVADATLSKLIWQVRHALGDDGETYVETVPRKGYRLVAAVAPQGVSATDPSFAEPPSLPTPTERVVASPRAWVWFMPAALAVVAAVLVWRAMQLTPDALAEARLLAVRAEALIERRAEADVLEAIRLYRQAVQLAPEDADLEAGLAVSLSLVAGVALPASASDSARQHARRALVLDPRHAGAETVLGLVAMNRDRDWAAAEAHFHRAIEYDPDTVRAHHWLGEMLVLLGERQDEGLRHLERAHALAPASAPIASDLAKAAFFSGRHQQAIEAAARALLIDPAYPHARRWRGLAYAELGQCRESLADLREAVALDPNPVVRGEQILVLGRCGQRGEARRLRDSLEQEALAGYISPIALMLARIGAGELEAALDAVEEALQSGNMVLGMAIAPHLDPIRSDPRFEVAVGQVR
jgi:DNA-binding winged helix-turn-helix (wHTH) protein/tetratricopeptide (TPR) repeat protein